MRLAPRPCWRAFWVGLNADVERCLLVSRQRIFLSLQPLGWDVRGLSTGLPTICGDKFFARGAVGCAPAALAFP
jgi:hypothetical protein